MIHISINISQKISLLFKLGLVKYFTTLLALSLLYNQVHVTERIKISPLEPILINYFLIVSFLEFKCCQLSFLREKSLRAWEYQLVRLSLGPTLRFRDLTANFKPNQLVVTLLLSF